MGAELFSIDSSGSASRPSSSPRALVYNFLILPYFLERLLTTGFCICLDCFLYLFTILPFRVALLTGRLIVRGVVWPVRRAPPSSSVSSAVSPALSDVLRFLLLLLSWYWLSLIPMSRIYHYIRGQSVLKLYVIFNMLQISDRLFASIGEDILDALFSSVALRLPLSVFHFSISSLYVFLHALLLFTQVITLNVSVNSDNSSLFIVLVSNNFVELKGAVFKRFDAHNLFQISCSDVVERFQLVVFLLVIVVMNVSHLGLMVAVELSWVEKAVTMCLMVLCGECAVDWIKHGFICKFNLISPRVYRQFTAIVNRDFLDAHMQGNTARSKGAHSVSRRLGLSSLPLAVLVLRVFGQAFVSRGSAGSGVGATGSWWEAASAYMTAESALKAALLLVVLCVLTVLKLLLTITLVGRIAVQALHEQDIANQEDASHTVDKGKTKAAEPPKAGSGAKMRDLKLESGENSATTAVVKGEDDHPNTHRVKREEDADTNGRRGRPAADTLTIETHFSPHRSQPTPELPMPALEVPLTMSSLSPVPPSPAEAGLTFGTTSEQSSMSASPGISPSSTAQQGPQRHEGDMLAVHDRVGSVELLGAIVSDELYTNLLAVDRYALTDQPIPP